MNSKLTKTAIDIGISEKDRKAIAKGLSELLADSYSLYLMTHNFHWNVKGPMFNTLHTMFMAQYTEQWAALDLIAERIRALGEPAPGTYKELSKLTSIKEIEGVPKAMDMVKYLVKAQEATAKTARKLFPIVEKANDQPTADLLTQRQDTHEKTAWMLRSLLEEQIFVCATRHSLCGNGIATVDYRLDETQLPHRPVTESLRVVRIGGGLFAITTSSYKPTKEKTSARTQGFFSFRW